MKTLFLPKILANEKKGGLCKTPHAVVLRRNAPPPLVRRHKPYIGVCCVKHTTKGGAFNACARA